VYINKEKGLRAETEVNICRLQFATRYFVCCFDIFRLFSKTYQFICVHMNKSDHTTESLIHWIGCLVCTWNVCNQVLVILTGSWQTIY